MATAVASTFATQASSPNPAVAAARVVTLMIVVITDTPMQPRSRVTTVVVGPSCVTFVAVRDSACMPPWCRHRLKRN